MISLIFIATSACGRKVTMPKSSRWLWTGRQLVMATATRPAPPTTGEPDEHAGGQIASNRNTIDLSAAVDSAVQHARDEFARGIGVKSACYLTTATIYPIGCELSDRGRAGVEAFCREHNLDCTRGMAQNPFLPATKVVFRDAGYDPESLDKDASKRARALKHLHSIGKPPGEITSYLRANGGIDGCLSAARSDRQTVARTPSANTASQRVATGARGADVPAPPLSEPERRIIQTVRARGCAERLCEMLEAGEIVFDLPEPEPATGEVSSSDNEEIEAQRLDQAA